MSRDDNKQPAQRGGVGVLGLLGVMFVGLKLTGFIGWSWWWLTAPFWGGFVIVISIPLIGLFIAGLLHIIVAAVEAVEERRRR